MAAVQQVLALPELLSSILECLEFDRAALCSAHLVNSTWARCTRVILWRNAPFSSLAAIEPARQQQYANLIRVSFSWNTYYPAELDRLAFPSLERCLFDAADLFNFPDMRMVLPPFFKASPQYLDMWLKGRDTPENLPEYIRQGLWEDKLDRRQATRKDLSEPVWSSIFCSRKLRSHISGKRPGDRRAGEVLALLASHEIYEEFFFYAVTIDMEAVDFLCSAITKRPLFPCLKHFGAFVRRDAPRVLFPLLPRTLSSLLLCVGSLAGPYYEMATQFTCLESLTIIGCEDILGTFPIQYLGMLHSLHSLAIELLPLNESSQFGWRENQSTQLPPFTDFDFDIMTSGVPLLHTLILNIPCKLSLSALRSLATNCPTLKIFKTCTKIDINDWASKEHPNLPSLDELVMTHGEYGDFWAGTQHKTQWSSRRTSGRPTMHLVNEDVVDPAHASMILRHCPNLSRLHLHLVDYGMFELGQIRAREGRHRWWDNAIGSAF
ncbi:hypothetical protein QM012_005557 [Aureobasidium pullulans]|uniref:F-box domain-containing protein n=1 Tax=Aureobasidium pullulans TaxID=5580 RepID=A0ABR0T4T1_AURPU